MTTDSTELEEKPVKTVQAGEGDVVHERGDRSGVHEYLVRSKTSKLGKVSGRFQAFVSWFEHSSVTRLFHALTGYLFLATLLTIWWDYGVRQEESKAREDSNKIAAWQLLAIKSPGNTGKKFALEYLNSVGEPVTGMDLSSKLDQPKVYLREVKVPGINLRYMNLTNSAISGADFSSSWMSSVDFTNSDSMRASFDGSNMTDVVYNFSMMKNVSFKKSNVYSSKFKSVILRDADFSRSIIQISDFSPVIDIKNLGKDFYWEYTFLIEAYMSSDVDIESQRILYDINPSYIVNVSFSKSYILLGNFDVAYMKSVDFSESVIVSPSFKHTYMKGVDLKNSVIIDLYEFGCESLKETLNWKTAHRPDWLACGAPIPSVEEVVGRWGKLKPDDYRLEGLKKIGYMK